MAFAPIPEYEGRSPYVFISYAQQDERIAYAIAVKMYNEGFRLWSSAACGNPSNMRIAERLSNSEVAMVFLSKSYLKYASYNEFEPRAVMNSPKQKIVVCLDDTPLGTDWNTVDYPAGIRYNPDVPQGLWLRINSSDTLEKCRGAWPKRPMPEPYEEKPQVNVSVDEEDITGELTDLNSVMSSFGAGLDDDEINNISLFRKDYAQQDQFKWPEKSEPTQEQEYYSIENLIDNSPMPISPEKKQYDSMIGLIESFMEKSSRTKEEELQRALDLSAQENKPPAYPVSKNTYKEYHPVTRNEFDAVDMTKDISSAPVVITQSSAPDPITLDYGEEAEIAAYSMTRSSGRAERVSEIMYYSSSILRGQPEQDYNEVADNHSQPPVSSEEAPPRPVSLQKNESKPADPADMVFEKIVDDRKFIKSTEDNMDGAKLTYHLGSAFDGFDENDYIQDEPVTPEPPKPESPKPEPPKADPVDLAPVRFTDDDIPLPALSFEKPKRMPVEDIEPERPRPVPPEPPKRTLSKPHRRYIVAVRRGIRHIEYDDEMYEVNGRWIPGHIYHRLMPNAKYTAIRRISRPSKPDPAQIQSIRPNSAAPLNNDSRLHSAVNTFFTPSSRMSESIPEQVRSALRERHEIRRSEAIRQLEENQAALQAQTQTPSRNQPVPTESDSQPARKHKFSHEGGIKKSLLANMETPVNTETEESHRQYGARAEAAAEQTQNEKKSKKKDEKAAKKAAKKAAEKAAQKKAESKKGDKKGKNKKQEEEQKSGNIPQQTAAAAFADVDDDSLIDMPAKNLPSLKLDPSAYSSMNLSEILFGEAGDNKKNQKKKKKK